MKEKLFEVDLTISLFKQIWTASSGVGQNDQGGHLMNLNERRIQIDVRTGQPTLRKVSLCSVTSQTNDLTG